MIISLTNGNFYVLKLISGRPTLYHNSGSHDLLSTYTCAATEQGTQYVMFMPHKNAEWQILSAYHEETNAQNNLKT